MHSDVAFDDESQENQESIFTELKIDNECCRNQIQEKTRIIVDGIYFNFFIGLGFPPNDQI